MKNSLLTVGVKTGKDLADLVHSGLKEIMETKRDGRTWVSQVSICPRQGALAATYVGEGVDSAAKKFYCEFGNVAEELILQGWYNSGTLLFADYSLPDLGINMGGKIDAILNYDGKIIVGEVKTCGTAMPSKPKAMHKAQAALYSAVTGLSYVIFYLSRNVADFNGKLKAKEFYFEFNREELKVNVFNAVYAHLCIGELVMPNKYIDKKDERCGFCKFSDVCWGDEIPHMDIASADEQMTLIRQANKMTETIMSESNIKKRRNGVLKHLSINGNDHAQKLLANEPGKPGKSWSELF